MRKSNLDRSSIIVGCLFLIGMMQTVEDVCEHYQVIVAKQMCLIWLTLFM